MQNEKKEIKPPQTGSISVKTYVIKRNENIEQTKPKVHQNFESKLYSTEPKQNTDNNRGQKETLFLGDYKGEEYKIKRQKNNEYNPNLYYKTKKANQTYNEHIYGKEKKKQVKSAPYKPVKVKVIANKGKGIPPPPPPPPPPK